MHVRPRSFDDPLDGLLYKTRNSEGVSYQSALLGAGGKNIGSINNMRVLWDHGVPASYAVACLAEGLGVERTIEAWHQDIPAEFATAL